MRRYFHRAAMPWLLIMLLCGNAQNVAALTLSATDCGIPLGPHAEYLEDKSGLLGIQALLATDASQFSKRDVNEQANFGYSGSAFWQKVELYNPSPITKEWLLELPFPTLDSVELYLVDAASREIMQQYRTGDLQPFAHRPYPHRHFVFPLSLATVKPYHLFIRVKSAGNLTLSSYLWQPECYQLHSRDGYLGMALYFGILSALFAYNLLLFFSLRDRLYLYYILFVASMALAQGAWSGLFFEYLWPGFPVWANLSVVFGFCATGLFGAVFSRRFLQTSRYTPRLDKVLLGSATMFAVLLPGVLLIPYQIHAMLTSLTGMVFSLVAVMSAIICVRQGDTSARFFLLAWGILLIGTAALGARNLDLIPANFFTLEAMLIGSVLEVLLLSFALADRISHLRRTKQQAEAELLKMQQEKVRDLEKLEHELEYQVETRTRELQDIAEQLRQQKEQLHNMALRDPLTGLANRHLLEKHARQAVMHADVEGQHMAVIVIDLDNFKPVNDRYGHDVGDELLQVIAKRLKQAVRGGDMVSRLGGDEFVVVLDSVNKSSDIEAICDKLFNRITEPVCLGELELTIEASIGVAVFPEDGVQSDVLLRNADMAMYEAKKVVDKKICYASSITGAATSFSD